MGQVAQFHSDTHGPRFLLGFSIPQGLNGQGCHEEEEWAQEVHNSCLKVLVPKWPVSLLLPSFGRDVVLWLYPMASCKAGWE